VCVTPLCIPDVKIIQPVRFEDDRGWFCETYRKDLIAKAGINLDFVQDNESFSVKVGTVRGRVV
jgi:dTDP-4-dehydrorhamnose 3,5-epimerase